MNEPMRADSRQLVDRLATRGVAVRSLSDSDWAQPHPEAIPILLDALEMPIDPWTKVLALGILGKPWASRAALPHLIRIFENTVFSSSGPRQYAFDENLVGRIASAPTKDIWPKILDYARRPDLGDLASSLLRRAGKFKSHADEVLALYSEFVGSDSIPIEMAITEGLRALGDPRGVTLLMRVNDLNASILRAKARTLDRLQGRD